MRECVCVCVGACVPLRVRYSKPANTDQKIDVYYSGGKLPSCEPFAISALKQVPGRYCKSAKDRAVGNDHFYDTTKRVSQRLPPPFKQGIPLYHRSGDKPLDPATLAKEMKWTNVALGSSSIEWDERRRRWNHVVSGSVLFCLPSESAESTPAAEGWQATPQACTRLAPNYRRSLLVHFGCNICLASLQ